MAVVTVLERHAPKDTTLAHLLRCLCFYAALFRLEFSASQIAGQRNMAADALSQDNLDLFSFLYPQVPHSPVPQVIQRLLLHSPPRLELSSIDKLVRQLFADGLSSSTISSYSSGIRKYLSFSFCMQFTFPPYPLSDIILCCFVAYLHSLHLTPRTISLYVRSVHFSQVAHTGQDTDLTSFSQLHYVLRGVRCQNPDSSRPRRLPITPAILRLLRHAWSQRPITHDQRMLWVACLLGFFVFLRSGEFTSLHGHNCTLEFSDVVVDRRENLTYMTIGLQRQTDHTGMGATIVISRTGDELCPVGAVLAFMAIRLDISGPLFVRANGSPLSREFLVQSVRTALAGTDLDTAGYNGHSFRIEAASTAAQAGLPDPVHGSLEISGIPELHVHSGSNRKVEVHFIDFIWPGEAFTVIEQGVPTLL